MGLLPAVVERPVWPQPQQNQLGAAAPPKAEDTTIGSRTRSRPTSAPPKSSQATQHVTPNGTFQLDMSTRLPIAEALTA